MKKVSHADFIKKRSDADGALKTDACEGAMHKISLSWS